uniref:Putative 2'-deoxynucleoside 5'-phosphate N-hydrolase 1 n=1 Tax=Phallusia mammillata TaxID=59560 RepID=A0A6F9DBU2_9ASCI|nr:2'-deoxynucleoside 5'-phosphate N-hydrolase 1-like [Phallusia mammillata]
MSKLSIYFCGSIRGGRNDAAIYHEIITHLKSFGKVFTEHVGSDKFNEEGIQIDDAKLTDKQIHDRDMSWLQSSDVVVAEVTTPSLGVGYELGRAIEMKKKVICLFRPSSGKRLSAMIEGAKCENLFQVHHYTEVKNACQLLTGILGNK